MATETATREYKGLAEKPVPWGQLEDIFDAIFGPDTRDLKRFPQSLHAVHASWLDATGVEHEADQLSDVESAYKNKLTARVIFRGWRDGGKPCLFDYRPGAVPPRASAVVQGAPDAVDAMIAPVHEAFPHQRSVIFISWSGQYGETVAVALRDILTPRLPAGGEVFISSEMRPGVDPFKEMLDRNLIVADAHLVVVTQDAANSHWVTWETAASWGRQRLVVPIFVDVEPDELKSPLPHLAQGVRINNQERLEAAVDEVVAAVGGNPVAWSADQRQLLAEAVGEPR